MKTKKLLSLLLALALALSLLPPARVGAEEPESWGLTICGEKVTADNCEDVLGNGMFVYDAEHRTLYLTGGTYEYHSESIYPVIASSVEGLTVCVLAQTRLGVSRPDLLCCSFGGKTVITGEGDLFLSRGVQIGSSLTLEQAYLYVENEAGMSVYGEEDTKLTVYDSTLYSANGLDGFSGKLSLIDAELAQPSDAELTDHGIVDASGEPVKNLLIQGKTRTYQLTVAGVRVSDRNKDDVLGDGSFVYEPSSSTLYTAGRLSYGGGPVIYCAEKRLSIRPLGFTVLTQTDELKAALHLNGCDTVLLGTEGLGLVAEDGYGVYAENGAKLTLCNTVVGVEADYGIAATQESSVLTLRGSDLDMDCTRASIGGFVGGIELVGSSFTGPEGCELKNGAVRNADNTLASEAHFENSVPFYKLKIDGVPVSYANCEDVLCNGVFRYDEESDVLEIRGSYTCVGPMIENMIDFLTIDVRRQSRLISRRDAVLQSWESVLLEGSYALECYGGYELGKDDCASVYLFSQDKTIRTLTVDLPALAVWGLRGQGSTGAADPGLVIDNCELSSTHELAVSGFSGIELRDCALALPEDGRISGGAVVNAEGRVADKVLISREGSGARAYALAVCGVEVTEENREDVLGDGCFRFDPETNTLRIAGSARSEDAPVIDNRISGLRVCAEGNCSFRAKDGALIATSGDMYVTSYSNFMQMIFDASEGEKDCIGIEARDADVQITLENLKLGILACSYGIAGHKRGEKLLLKNAGVEMLYAEQAAICDFGGGVTLEDCTLQTPENGVIDGGDVLTGDGELAKNLNIVPDYTAYDLYVCGVQVTDRNAEDVLGDGVFCFDTTEFVLEIQGNASSFAAPCVESGEEELQLTVSGTCRLEAQDADVIVLHGFTYFCNYDREEASADELVLAGNQAGIRCYGSADLDLYDLRATIRTDGPGITGADILWFDNCEIESSAICGNWYIGLDYDTILEPEGGRIDNGEPEEEKEPEKSGGVKSPEKSMEARITDAEGNTAEHVVLTVNPFLDVSESKYYYDAVLWALYAAPQVTNGVDRRHFGPDNHCTRAQVVTFLWRANGCPTPKTTQNPFADVKESAYYCDAVLWALEKGITKGTDDEHFSPGAACNRGQVVTFLHRAKGEPEPYSSNCPFVDVKQSAFYYTAMLWAVGNGITKGMDDTHFAPSNTCTRGQVVTFLARAIDPRG